MDYQKKEAEAGGLGADPENAEIPTEEVTELSVNSGAGGCFIISGGGDYLAQALADQLMQVQGGQGRVTVLVPDDTSETRLRQGLQRMSYVYRCSVGCNQVDQVPDKGGDWGQAGC